MRLACLALVACASRPHVELRAQIPTTDFCQPQQYTKLSGFSYRPPSTPHVELRDDGLYIDGAHVADPDPSWDRRHDEEHHALSDGRWLVMIAAPADEALMKAAWPHVAYVWDPASKLATNIGEIFTDTDASAHLDGFFLLVRDRSLVLADIDPTAPSARPFDAFTGQQIAGYSAGHAVLWKRDGETATLSCLGDAAHSLHMPLATNLRPAGDFAVRDQRLLLQEDRPTPHDGKLGSDVWILDLDQRRIRFIGIAPSICMTALHNSYDNACWNVSNVGWLVPDPDPEGILMFGYLTTRVDPTTEALHTPPP